MAREKVAKLGIKRAKGYLYFVNKGAVWQMPLAKRGKPYKGKREKVAEFGGTQDTRYLYFLDKQGDVSRALRASAKKGKKASKKRGKK